MSKFTTSMKTFGSTLSKGAKAHSPEILTIAGIIGFVGAGIIACRSSMKLKDQRAAIKDERNNILDSKKLAEDIVKTSNAPVLDNPKADSIYGSLTGRDKIEPEILDNAEKYLSEDHKKELNASYRREIFMYVKLYGPAVGLAIASTVSILAGHNIMRKRAAALAAAYATLERSFAQYRKRVIDTYGEDVDKKFRKGVIGQEDVEITTTDEDGNEVTTTEKADIIDPSRDYSILFDATPMYQHSPQKNYTILKAFQNYLNEQLHARGSLLLNDVYDQFGIPRSSDGAVVGWSVKDPDGRKADGYVDFGLDFDDLDLNHWKSDIWLDLNCDGFVQNLISDNK